MEPFTARWPKWLQISIAWGLLAPLVLVFGWILQLPRVIASLPRWSVLGLYWLWQATLLGIFSYTFGGVITAWFSLLLLPALFEPWQRDSQGALSICVLSGVICLLVRFAFHQNERVEQVRLQTLPASVPRKHLPEWRIWMATAIMAAMLAGLHATFYPVHQVSDLTRLHLAVVVASVTTAPIILAVCLIPDRA